MSQSRSYLPGIRDTKLRQWRGECPTKARHPGAARDRGQLYGSIRIAPDHDASFAQAHARTVNLGTVDRVWHALRLVQNNEADKETSDSGY